MKAKNRKNTILLGLILILGCGRALAQFTLDWDGYGTSDWADGALEGTFSDIEASGIEFSLVVHDDVFKFANDRHRIRTVDETSPNGKKFPQFGKIDFNGAGTDSISPASVDSVSFQMIDVDASSKFNDRLTLSESPILSEVVVTQNRSMPEHDMSGALLQMWYRTGSVLADNVYETALNDFEGAIQVEYGTVNSLTFTFESGPGAPVNSAEQDVGMYDIALTSLTSAPEPGPIGPILAGSFFFLNIGGIILLFE